MKLAFRFVVMGLALLLTQVSVAMNITHVRNEYAVNTGDKLVISVLQPEQYEAEVTVAPDGNVSFFYLGSVQVKGMGLSDIQQVVSARLAEKYLSYPLVTVHLKESNSNLFYIYGDVNKPGSYGLSSDMTVLNAIAQAGGFAKRGAHNFVRVLRPLPSFRGYNVIPVDMDRLYSGSGDQDILLRPGDTVEVMSKTFYVYGDVRSPGAYQLLSNTTVLKAISIAGGFKDGATPESVRIMRERIGAEGYKTIKVDVAAIMAGDDARDLLVQAEDVLVVVE